MNCSALKPSVGFIRWLSYYAKNATWWDFPLKEAREYQVNCYKKNLLREKKFLFDLIAVEEHLENQY